MIHTMHAVTHPVPAKIIFNKISTRNWKKKNKRYWNNPKVINKGEMIKDKITREEKENKKEKIFKSLLVLT